MKYEYVKVGMKVKLVKQYSDGDNRAFENKELVLGNIYEVSGAGIKDQCWPISFVGAEYDVSPDMIELFLGEQSIVQQQNIDSHYDFFYTLTESDIVKKTIKVDPYFVSNLWKLGSKDESGILFHCLKTISRFGDKNPVEREIIALHKQIKRLAEIHNVNLEDK